jgi:hypothetical protein
MTSLDLVVDRYERNIDRTLLGLRRKGSCQLGDCIAMTPRLATIHRRVDVSADQVS